MKIAHIMLIMADGNSVAHHIRGKNHKHLVKKVSKRLKKPHWDLGSVLIECDQVADWGYSFEGEVN